MSRYEDLVEGISTERDVNKQTGQTELIVKQHRGELHPQIVIYADKECKELVGTYPIPAGAYYFCCKKGNMPQQVSCSHACHAARSRQRISPGVFLALPSFSKRASRKIPQKLPKSTAWSTSAAFRRTSVSLLSAMKMSGMEEEHLIPHTKHLIVQRGDHVVKGQQLTDGVVIPHEILEICGVRELQKYLVNQVQEVYRLQGVDINDKHIEIIVRQMLQESARHRSR